MAIAGFADFGELYRAAFAECDPDRKSILLHEVQIALAEWERHAEPPASPPPLSRAAAGPPA